MTTRLVAFGFLVRGYENEDDATVLDSLDGASNIGFPVSQEFDIVQDRKGRGRAEKEVTLLGADIRGATTRDWKVSNMKRLIAKLVSQSRFHMGQ